MFLVFNKDKAISCVVTVFTVVVLFLTASFFKDSEESIPTSINDTKLENIVENNIIENENILLNNN